MKLFGSQTSPFVRRVRILCAQEQINYEFVKIDYNKEEDAKLLGDMSKVRRIPLIQTEVGEVIFDSTIIAEYLYSLKGKSIALKDRLTMKLIDEVNDSLVILFQLKKYETDVNWTSKFAQTHKRRVADVFGELEQIAPKITELSSLTSIWLFCLIDWNNFRNIFDLKDHKNLLDFHSRVTLKSSALISDSMPSI